jgi:hypothetical protein
MSEKQSDIAERLRVMADDLVLFKEIDTGADDMREAADEIEALRADLDKCAKLALSAVHAEREAILELIEAQRADAHLYNADYALETVAAAIRARGEQQ